MIEDLVLIDTILLYVQILTLFIVAGAIVVPWYFSDDRRAQILTARIFLRYLQFRRGVIIVAIAAAVELLAYTVALLTDTLNDPLVLSTFIVSSALYIIGFALMVLTTRAQKKKQADDMQKEAAQ